MVRSVSIVWAAIRVTVSLDLLVTFVKKVIYKFWKHFWCDIDVTYCVYLPEMLELSKFLMAICIKSLMVNFCVGIFVLFSLIIFQ